MSLSRLRSVWPVLALFLSCPSAFAVELEGSVDVKAPPSSQTEGIFIADYRVSCHSLAAHKSFSGVAEYQGRKIRFDLFAGKTTSEFQIGEIGPNQLAPLTYKISLSPACRLHEFKPRIELVDLEKTDATIAQALKYSPFIVVRDDQIENRETDLPLTMAYTVRRLEDRRIEIQYTAYFSDEDSQDTVAKTDGQMARYGRRLDVEWVSKVFLRADGTFDRQEHQAPFRVSDLLNLRSLKMSDVGHVDNGFNGKFLGGKNSGHPILYNVANNNLFDGIPTHPSRTDGLVGYHLVPRIRIDWPHARERVGIESETWMLQVSDDEMKRENKMATGEAPGPTVRTSRNGTGFVDLPVAQNTGVAPDADATSEQFLYILVEGPRNKNFAARLFSGFVGVVTYGDGFIYQSGGGASNVDRVGENMWERQTYTAIPLGGSRLQSIGIQHGRVTFSNDRMLNSGNLEILKFFRLVRSGNSFVTEDITRLFRCRLGTITQTTCEF